jgi:hypothetical protein
VKHSRNCLQLSRNHFLAGLSRQRYRRRLVEVRQLDGTALRQPVPHASGFCRCLVEVDPSESPICLVLHLTSAVLPLPRRVSGFADASYNACVAVRIRVRYSSQCHRRCFVEVRLGTTIVCRLLTSRQRFHRCLVEARQSMPQRAELTGSRQRFRHCRVEGIAMLIERVLVLFSRRRFRRCLVEAKRSGSGSTGSSASRQRFRRRIVQRKRCSSNSRAILKSVSPPLLRRSMSILERWTQPQVGSRRRRRYCLVEAPSAGGE